jgi:hypothetical protein
MPSMSSAPLRAVAALGGALGALPLIPIVRTLAMNVSGPPRLIGRELADYDFKSATYAEAAVFLLVLPLTALFFGWWLPRVAAGVLPGIVFAASLAAWRLGLRPKLALGAGAVLAGAAVILGLLLARRSGAAALPEPPPESEAPSADPPERRGWARWIAPSIVLLVLAVCGWRMYGHRRGQLEFFEDGHMLTNAQTYLSGGRPYVDTYPVHGWGADGGLEAIVFRFAAPTLDVFWSLHSALAALAVAGLALGCWVLFRRWLWAGAAFLLSLTLCPFLSARQFPAFLTLAALVAAARARRGALWFLAGVLGALTLFYSLDFGVFVLTAAVLAASALGLLERRPREGLTALGLFATGALAGALPFLAILAGEHALAGFVRVSFDQLPRSIEDIWGLPAGSTTTLLRDGSARDGLAALLSRNPARPLRWLTPVLLLGLSVTVLLFRAASRRLDAVDRGAIAATAVAVVSARGILGRADAGHLALYGVLAGIPATWLIYRAGHALHYRPAIAALGVALSVLLLVRFDPRWMLKTWWLGVRGPDNVSASAPAPDAGCWRTPVRGGRALVPCAEADELDAFRRHLDAHLRPDETFFDFSNQAALYFYADRPNPIRFVAAPFYEPEAFQHEVIAALERERPPMVVLPHGEWTDTFDGIANALRTPLVADYVYANYRVVEVVAGRFVGWRSPPSP